MGIMGTFLRRRGRDKYVRNQERGDNSELRAFRAVERCVRDKRPWWITAVERTPKFSKLDRIGVDLLIDTEDVGRLRIQVKSSEAAAQEFVEKGRDKLKPTSKLIGVVVILPGDDDNTVYGKLLGTLMKLHDDEVARVKANAEEQRKTG